MKTLLIVALCGIAYLSQGTPKKEKWIQLFNGKNLKTGQSKFTTTRWEIILGIRFELRTG